MKIIYTGAFRFPNKDAASQRVLSIGKILKKIGYEVLFFGWEKTERSLDLCNEGGYFYQDFQYFSQNELDLGFINPFTRLYNFIFRGKKTINNIRKYIKNNKVDFIVAYNSNIYFLYSLQKLALHNNIVLICDCTEWYEADHLPGGKYGLANFDNNFRINKIYPKIKNVIVISSFLAKHLNSLNCNTIVIPPLVDLNEQKWEFKSEFPVKSNSLLRLIYAGNPGQKDLLTPFFEALKIVNSENRFEFLLLGSTSEYIKKQYFSNLDFIPAYIVVKGNVPMEDVPSFYKSAHFSLLLREDKRYAHAGFPTKLGESLSMGVPIITNDTSDIKKYIINNYNGFILENISIESIVDCLEKLLLLSEHKINEMNGNAKKTSLNSFDFNNYCIEIENYLNICKI